MKLHRSARTVGEAARIFGTPSQIRAETARRGQGHVFEAETEGSRWCATCGHDGRITSHARAAR